MHQTIRPAERPDYASLPPLRPSDRQLQYAGKIAASAGIALPKDVQLDRAGLSRWIEANRHRIAHSKRVADKLPTARQIAWAERIARGRKRNIPEECYKSRELLAKWIDANSW
ncbi:MAG: hypothetical protein F4213_18410 [Boseongicola sp. SB0677_bin_26]|nr:hypothetical protein [Boseongicola sp. SB0665_bin_10]MYG27966.1 hypothetical protein [Boseongicola sp. SB0677_bin_26]